MSKFKYLTIIPMVCLTLFSFQKSEMKQEIIDDLVPVKLVGSGINEEGKQYQTFTYAVLPEDTVNKEVCLHLYWAENNVDEEVSDYIEYTHDPIMRSVTVILLKKANHQIILEVEHLDTGNNGAVRIDFYKDHLGWKETTYDYFEIFDIKNNEPLLTLDDVSEYILTQSLGLGDGTLNKGPLEVNIKNVEPLYEPCSFDFYDIVDGEFILRQENHWFYDFDDNMQEVGKIFASFEGYGSNDAFLDNDIYDCFISMDNVIKRIVSEYQYLAHYGVYNVTFDFYDEVDVIHKIAIHQLVPISEWSEYLEIRAEDVDINNENIIF